MVSGPQRCPCSHLVPLSSSCELAGGHRAAALLLGHLCPMCCLTGFLLPLLLQEAEEKGDEQPGKEKFEDDFFDTMSSDATGGLPLLTPHFSWLDVANGHKRSWPEASFWVPASLRPSPAMPQAGSRGDGVLCFAARPGGRVALGIWGEGSSRCCPNCRPLPVPADF